MKNLLNTLKFNAIITGVCISLIGHFIYCLGIGEGEMTVTTEWLLWVCCFNLLVHSGWLVGVRLALVQSTASSQDMSFRKSEMGSSEKGERELNGQGTGFCEWKSCGTVGPELVRKKGSRNLIMLIDHTLFQQHKMPLKICSIMAYLCYPYSFFSFNTVLIPAIHSSRGHFRLLLGFCSELFCSLK